MSLNSGPAHQPLLPREPYPTLRVGVCVGGGSTELPPLPNMPPITRRTPYTVPSEVHSEESGQKEHGPPSTSWFSFPMAICLLPGVVCLLEPTGLCWFLPSVWP